MVTKCDDLTPHWFAMRDLKRSNAKLPAYKMLSDLGFEVFTPMTWKLSSQKGKYERKQIPFMHDLLFVHGSKQDINPIERKTPTLQYRFQRHGYCEPIIVRDEDMESFIYAVNNAENIRYYLPEELTPQMYNRTIRIQGGPLDGYEGKLLTVRGSKVKRLLIELPNLITVGIEVDSAYIQIL